jgi:hypothetical protein
MYSGGTVRLNLIARRLVEFARYFLQADAFQHSISNNDILIYVQQLSSATDSSHASSHSIA